MYYFLFCIVFAKAFSDLVDIETPSIFSDVMSLF
jgi:hypothetical protein